MNKQRLDYSIDFLLKNKWRIPQHLLFWIFNYLDEILSIFGITEPYPITGDFWLILILDILTVYICLYVFIPKLLLKNKGSSFLLAVIALTFVNSLLTYCITDYFDPEYIEEVEVFSYILSSFLFTAYMVGFAIGMKLFKHFLRESERLRALEKANLETELAYLKLQLNPHFLFNALNGIYVQTRSRPKEAGEAVLLLSDLLRYQLYDCKNDTVALNKEVEFIKDYLELDKLRKNHSNNQIEVNYDVKNIKIPPFLFIAFVENACKYSSGVDKNSYVKITIDVKDAHLHFTTENSIDQFNQNIKGGIGLANVERRLQLLYGNNYTLDIDETKERYLVHLKIPL